MLFSTELICSPNFSHDQFNIEELTLKVCLSGRFDLYNSSELYTFIKIIKDGGLNKVLLNLDKLKEIDSTGIGTLMKTISLLKGDRGKIALTDVPDSILKVLKLVKVDTMVEIFNTEDDSLSYFKLK
jgi:anti-sigma B factor antagonist